MNQAMIWGVVPTSGRGDVLIGSHDFHEFGRVAPGDAFELAEREAIEGSQVTPPLPPPNGRSTTAHFQVIQNASQRRDFIEGHARMEADAALGRSRERNYTEPGSR